MFNPLVSNLSNLSDSELTEKIETLWIRAQQMRYNYSISQQIQALIHTYTTELSRRQNLTIKSE